MWKDVVGFDGIYQISNLGKVRKIVNGGFKYIAHPSDGRIEFWKDGERTKRASISKLVYDHFGIPSEEGEVWSDVEGEDYIKVSNQGRLFNTKTGHFIGNDSANALGFCISKLVVKSFGLPTEEGEEWRDIEGHENYQVSNFGRVRNVETGRILKQTDTNKNKKYKRVCIEKGKLHLVHRLVAQAFLPNPDPEHLTQINHIDENPYNNHINNLEWCDARYNINYGTRTHRMSERLSEIYKRKRKEKLDKCKTEEERQKVLKAQDHADAVRKSYLKHKK